MEGRTQLIIFFSGLCLLPACFPRLYIPVKEPKTWVDAQRYCRQKYTDLASVNNQEESDQLIAAAPAVYEFWLGLSDDVGKWRWSLEKEGYYGEGEANFRNWNGGEPNNEHGKENRVVMFNNGRWNDASYDHYAQFVCYNEKSKKNSTASFILVNELKTWKEAQSYCRKHFTDLPSVRNQAENDEIQNLSKGIQVWIGLYRDSWKWSDGRPYSFTNWESNLMNNPKNQCALINEGMWEKVPCDKTIFFVCHKDQITQQVLQMKLTKNSPSLNLEDAADAILQQLGQTLKGHGLSKNVNLTWRKQSDGKIFKLEEKTEKKKNI